MPTKKFINWFFLSSLLGGSLFYFFPKFTDLVYGEWIFPSVRLFYNTLSFISPIPLVLFFILWCIVLLVGYFIKKPYAAYPSFLNKLMKVGADLLYFALFLIASFYWVWGMNYFRSSESARFHLEVEAIEQDRLKDWILTWTEEINNSRTALPFENDEDVRNYLSQLDLNTHLEKSFYELKNFHQLTAFRHVPVMLWRPKGLWLRNSTAGFYFPFTGEATLDNGLHPYQIPFTTAHEMAHAIGFTDEGVCNLLAVLVCMSAENEFIQYSGKLTLWRYLAREIRRLDPDFYATIFEEKLSDAVKNDLIAIHRNSQKYPDWFPGLQRRVYDTYLRAHGIREGIASYNEVLMLADSYFKLFSESENDID